MFSKSDKERITETVTMIGRAPDLTGPIRAQIVAFVNTQFPRLTAADKLAYAQLSSDMSVKRNIATGVQKGSEPEREKRRAVYLLWMAIGKAQNIDLFIKPRAAQAMSMGTAALDDAFSDAMLKAAVVASPAGAQWAYTELSAHPKKFISRHRIIVLGSAAGGDRFSTAPNGNYQNVLTFDFRYNAGEDRFELGAVADATLGASHAFQTVSVPAVHWSQVPGAGPAPCNFAGVLGCELAGANFMVTTQFTGCAFNWTTHLGVVRASHISPSGGGPGTYPGGGNALAQRLMLNGAMSNAGNTAVTVFGGGAGNAPVAAGNAFYPDTVATAIRWVSIIGVNKGGVAWQLYTQVISGSLQILEARRIL
jgi:hypothetical protein